jgi:hypothetical protein
MKSKNMDNGACPPQVAHQVIQFKFVLLFCVQTTIQFAFDIFRYFHAVVRMNII